MQLMHIDSIIRDNPPLPPILNKKPGRGDRSLTAILVYNDKKYYVDCLTRNYTPKYRFHESELGNVVFNEDGTTLEYSEKHLDLSIYDNLRRFIKCWKKSFSEF